MPPYIGRFAPSPTGPLHMGSLLAALISFLDAKAQQGKWLVRIEDIDPPREVPGATDQIIESLLAHGLQWDGDIVYQSSRHQIYEQNLKALLDKGYCYSCPCSRKQISENGGKHLTGCGALTNKVHENAAIRFRSSNQNAAWTDIFLGERHNTVSDDFVLKRRDGLYAYQLAVVSDDIAQNISHVVRGVDLLDSTPVQILLYEALGKKPPEFGHFPLVLNTAQQKLSKQNLAPAISKNVASSNLRQCANWLGLNVTNDIDKPSEMVGSMVKQWTRSTIQAEAFVSM